MKILIPSEKRLYFIFPKTTFLRRRRSVSLDLLHDFAMSILSFQKIALSWRTVSRVYLIPYEGNIFWPADILALPINSNKARLSRTLRQRKVKNFAISKLRNFANKQHSRERKAFFCCCCFCYGIFWNEKRTVSLGLAFVVKGLSKDFHQFKCSAPEL